MLILSLFWDRVSCLPRLASDSLQSWRWLWAVICLLTYLILWEKNLKGTSWPQPLRSRGQPLTSDPCLYLPQDYRHVTSCPVCAEVGIDSRGLDRLGKQSNKWATPPARTRLLKLCLSIGFSKKWCHDASFQIWVLLVSQFSTWGNPWYLLFIRNSGTIRAKRSGPS